MKWEEVQTTADLLTYCDQRYRGFLLGFYREPERPERGRRCRWVDGTIARRFRSASALDVAEVWQRLMLKMWADAMTPDLWRDEGHLCAWLHGAMSRGLRFLWGHQVQRRRHQLHGEVYEVLLLSELQAQEMEQTLQLAAREPRQEVQQLGPSRDWLWAAVRDLTPLQRRAVELCIVGDLTVTQAAEVEGVSYDVMKRRGKAARRALRERVPYRLVEGRVVWPDAA